MVFELLQDLKIFAARHYGLEGKHYTSMLLDCVLPILRTKFRVKLVWFFYMPEKMDFSSFQQFDVDVMDIHNYADAVEVLKDARPDIIINNEYPSIMDLAIDEAAKFLNIPVVTIVPATDRFKITTKQLITSFLPLFFHSSMPSEQSNKQQFMRRGRFFLFKYMFLLKSLRAVNMRILDRIKYFFSTLKWHLSYETPFINHKFATTLHCLESETLVNRMLSAGFSKSEFAVIGNPIYDEAFKKYANYSPVNKLDKKINILFVPIQFYEGGLWTKNERNVTIQEIIKNISEHKDEFSLMVKLHPSSQVYEDYESIIHNVDPSVPIYQKGVLMDFLEGVDLVVSFSPISAALFYPLIARKPLVLCNFFNFKYLTTIGEGVAWECTDPKQLVKTIRDALDSHSKNEKKLEEFLNKVLYKSDGLAAERFCNVIEILVAKKLKK